MDICLKRKCWTPWRKYCILSKTHTRQGGYTWFVPKKDGTHVLVFACWDAVNRCKDFKSYVVNRNNILAMVYKLRRVYVSL